MALSYENHGANKRESSVGRRSSSVVIGDRIYSSLNNDWDLDAAFLNASDPYLYIIVKCEKDGKIEDRVR